MKPECHFLRMPSQNKALKGLDLIVRQIASDMPIVLLVPAPIKLDSIFSQTTHNPFLPLFVDIHPAK